MPEMVPIISAMMLGVFFTSKINTMPMGRNSSQVNL